MLMNAAFIETTGPPDVIRYGKLPVPRVLSSHVLVRVTALSVNPIDVYIRNGAYPIPLPYPFVIGRDMVGVVESLAEDVTQFARGQRVWCNNQGYDGRQGTFSEFVSIDEELLYPLPDAAGEREAVAVVHSGLTACTGLVRCAKIRSGEKLFVNGGAGNVGTAVIQIGNELGARVIASSSNPDKMRRCIEAGAERVINYQTEDVEHAVREFAPDGLDVHWDTSGKPDFERAVPLMAHGGRILVMTGLRARPTFPVGAFYTRDCSMHGFAITNASPAQLRECAETINDFLSSGKLKARIDRVMPLSQAGAAHRLVEERSAELDGKIVVVPDESD